jgi:hypothetical protein
MIRTPASTLREWAAEALDAEADASPSAGRAAFLKRLAADDFLPPEEAVEAANVLGNVNVPLTDGAKADAAANEAELVDRFAQGYWSLPPDVRFHRWHELQRQLTDGEAKSRMRDLEAGLGIAVVPQENPLIESVAREIRELYVLKPRDLVIRRTEWLIENQKQIADLRDAAKRLRAEHHEFNRLVPSLAVELARAPRLETVPPIDAVFAEAEREEAARKEQVQAEAAVRRTATRAESAGSSGGSGGGWPIYVIIGIGLFALRACLAVTKPDPTPTYRFDPPPALHQRPNFPPASSRFSQKEILDCMIYDLKTNQQKRSMPTPVRWEEWLNAGRPMKATP